MASRQDGELARVVLPDGNLLTLLQRGDDFEIRFNLVELMSSRNAISERALARLACARLGDGAASILIGGLGMGYMLRSVLDHVGERARVTVSELVPEVVIWNRGPLAGLADRPLDDPRVAVHVGDVAALLRASPRRFDAVLMDVDNGPEAILFPSNQALYSSEGVNLVLSALKPGGTFGLWAADRSLAFEQVLETVRLQFERVEVSVGPDGADPTHTLYLVSKDVAVSTFSRHPAR